ncbi:MAG: ATPase, partial [Myxococcales bacterium]|nr:ATPase [Myxococcales bacterium]
VRARRGLHDELLALEARGVAAETARAFVVEGWVPARARAALDTELHARLGDAVVVETVGRDHWRGAEAPVVLTNPRVFEPFERLTAMLPLPRYGSVDPTPFVAVFFPMLFGIIVGDVGYGLLLATIAAILFARGRGRGLARDLAKIAAAVASYMIIFGVLYGELFGDLGERWFGMRPLWLDREDAVLPFLGLAIALGLVHMLLGLVVSAISRRGHPREAAGRGLTALMLLLIALALATVFELLPHALFTPAIVALLVAFPILIALEGATALLELLTTVGHVLSYARVMALGTASVMLAVVANRMVGAFGGAVIGVVFALLFHLVNFAIALFSPTIHVLRLHYVEFFGTFFSPGGGRYQPFAHWSPGSVASP